MRTNKVKTGLSQQQNGGTQGPEGEGIILEKDNVFNKGRRGEKEKNPENDKIKKKKKEREKRAEDRRKAREKAVERTRKRLHEKLMERQKEMKPQRCE